MKRLLPFVLLMACGAPTGPGTTYFWNITGSTIEWGSLCSDNAMFRTPMAIPFTADSYVIYKISDDGKKAVSQECSTLNSASCRPQDGGTVFDIAGTELSSTDEGREPGNFPNCVVLTTVQSTLTNSDPAMTLTISGTLSLVDDPPACDKMQANIVGASPNGQGYQGCTLTRTLTGTRYLP